MKFSLLNFEETSFKEKKVEIGKVRMAKNLDNYSVQQWCIRWLLCSLFGGLSDAVAT